jgi:hypothetical protein
MNADREMSSREYEREAEASRHRLAGNLRELSDRLTPGNIVDEVLSYARSGGGTFFNALTNAARDNPVPSLLIGAGLLMFLSEKTGLTNMIGGHQHDRSRPYGIGDGYRGRLYRDAYAGYAAERGNMYAGNRGHGIRDAVGGAAAAARDGLGRAADAGRHALGDAAAAGAGFAGNVAAGVRDTADRAYEGARRGAESVGAAMANAADAARSAAEGVGATMASAADEMRHRVQEFGGAVGDIGQRLYDEARETPRRVGDTVTHARDSLMSMVKEQPLMAGAVGLAIGAAIAAALPKTEAEDQLLGEASDNLKDAAAKLAASEMENAKSVATSMASKVASEVGKVADEHGVSAQGAAAAVHAATDKLKDAVGLQGKDVEERAKRTDRL